MNSEMGHVGREASRKQRVGPESDMGARGTGLEVLGLGAPSWGLGVNEIVPWGKLRPREQ